MSSATINIAIENLFATAWGATTTVRYDSVPFTIPQTAWVGLEVWDGNINKASLGKVALRRSNGTVFVTVNSPINVGSNPARTLADSVVAIFRDKQVSGITFLQPNVRRIGEAQVVGTGAVSGTTQWYQIVVAVPFIHDVVI